MRSCALLPSRSLTSLPDPTHVLLALPKRQPNSDKRSPEEHPFHAINKTPSVQSTHDQQPQPPISLSQARNPQGVSEDRDGQSRTTICLDDIAQTPLPAFITAASSPALTQCTSPGSPTMAVPANPMFLGQVRILASPLCMCETPSARSCDPSSVPWRHRKSWRGTIAQRAGASRPGPWP